MTVQFLGPRKLKKLGALTGLNLVRGIVRGGWDHTKKLITDKGCVYLLDKNNVLTKKEN